jgi:hypothetical protein
MPRPDAMCPAVVLVEGEAIIRAHAKLVIEFLESLRARALAA